MSEGPGPRVKMTVDATKARLQYREGVLVRLTNDSVTGAKIAVVRWDGNKSESRISPRFIEPADDPRSPAAAFDRFDRGETDG